MLLCQKARTQSSYLFSKHPNKDVQKCVREVNDEELVGYISRVAESIRGTRPYWSSQLRDLEAIIRQLNFPHFFFTWSNADIHWMIFTGIYAIIQSL